MIPRYGTGRRYGQARAIRQLLRDPSLPPPLSQRLAGRQQLRRQRGRAVAAERHPGEWRAQALLHVVDRLGRPQQRRERLGAQPPVRSEAPNEVRTGSIRQRWTVIVFDPARDHRRGELLQRRHRSRAALGRALHGHPG
eukprot:CAMPEP_0196710438 /NCGR_PEP_ID=MMETSP1090-20130531/70196_1 /TAXON_ID=37098 /ORGANISM="Isochrysis sp, Strain CCMP1244" /LENGTH=138 /DNA_ID=CAMNT_0042050467 /DNA_START=105 /DNA_END=518 /DNA_ORIENTATION=-